MPTRIIFKKMDFKLASPLQFVLNSKTDFSNCVCVYNKLSFICLTIH